ncbi:MULTISPECIES: DNA-dependent RNA polymerase subunit epsilon [Listeria]|uniref:DNA-directed RNA polymerase subunit epsilon n=2 Tax=Listeria TaxID=1637 RepID=A0A099W6I6_9LIST|nr:MULTISPECIES: DNA-directed RNA polymerase subunit epsilon [Listeria]EUJ46830.1 hypothetical protein PRIP_00839 [Listeria riparia FSL S10-1204]KGL40391.1 hypothetical protein EP57_10865 [Listeria booriae]MBC1210141.1 DNA-dependent RNA polymerase auxiliary subunit epsilon family protein [Listeria booriae]MBC1225794.1 DNA-dependent RNA polymerase auxiliary subunit epsilon family protein [Listeria booriae]MBC1229397.1 DNA-dependent RNA polymerase auxiliary subunit epsilon family protein [Lister
MIFKVYFQETKTETPVREKTKSIYVEASGAPEVRVILKDQPFHIELIEELSEAHLQYEKQNEDFQLWGQ